MVSPTIRMRQNEDIDHLVRILEAVHVHDRWPVCHPGDWAAWLRVPNESGAWVIELDGEVVGHGSLQSPPTSGLMLPFWQEVTNVTADQMVEVTRVFLDPSKRSSGLGRALFEAVVDAARQSGKVPVLYTSEIDVAAQRLYERSGWRRVGSATEVLPNGESLLMLAYI